MPSGREGLAQLVEREGVGPRVVAAFRAVARADYVPEAAQAVAYEDRPIEILERQTTSQPSLIARMIDAADVLPGDRVLEVGTGFGYQTALLAALGAEVVSIDRHGSIAEAARANLDAAGVTAEVVVGDGWQGWPERAPYDAIVVSAAAPKVPDALGRQLVEGGRLVIPISGARGDDVLVFVKSNDHLVRVRLLTPARFVPLVGDERESDQSNE